MWFTKVSSKRDGEPLHALIVEAIEGLHRDHLAEQVERLAYHATFGETWEKAVTYWRQSGLRALSHSSHDHAIDCFERALTALRHLLSSPENVGLAIDLRLDIRTAMLPLGRFKELLEHLNEAERLAEGLKDQLRLGRVCAYLTTTTDRWATMRAAWTSASADSSSRK